MNSVILSFSPAKCYLIAKGEKLIEMRKLIPNIKPPFKCYIYCTKEKPLLGNCSYSNRIEIIKDKDDFDYYNKDTLFKCNGKVIGEFICTQIEEYKYDYCPHPEIGLPYNCGDDWYEIEEEHLKAACLTYDEFYAYGNQGDVYGLYISNLNIYSKPKELFDYKHKCRKHYRCSQCIFSGKSHKCNNNVTAPPRGWYYIESEE